MGGSDSARIHKDPVKEPTEESATHVALDVEVIKDRSALEALKPQWRRLVLDSDGASAFSTPAAVMTWYRHVDQHSGVHAVVVRRRSELVGLAPFSVTRLGPFRLLSSVGAGYGYDGNPLLGSDPGPVATAIADHLSKLVANGMAAVYLRRLSINGTMLRALTQRDDIECQPMGSDETHSVVRFDEMPDPDDYFKTMARKHAVPRRYRRLAEHFEHIEYVVADTNPIAALDAMRDMLRRRFDSDLRIFRTPENRVLTRALVSELIAAGHARVRSFNADGERIAVTIDLQVARRVYSYAVAYEPNLAKFSIGHLELYEYLRDAHDSGTTEVDLGSAGFAYKQIWANAHSDYRTVSVTTRGWRGEIANNLRRAAIRAHRARRLGNRGDVGPHVV